MRRAGTASAATLMLLVALAGCSAPDDGSEASAARSPAASTTAGADPSTSEPEAPDAAPPNDSDAAAPVEEDPAVSSVDPGMYLERVRAALRPDTAIAGASDEELLAVGARACEALANGEDTTGVSFIDGEQPNMIDTYADTEAVIAIASTLLC